MKAFEHMNPEKQDYGKDAVLQTSKQKSNFQQLRAFS